MQEIIGSPRVYTTKEGTKNWIHTNLYQETALCLDSFCWLKVETSTINLYNYYPLLVPECLCQARIVLTDIIAISHDISTGDISRLVYGRGRFDLPHKQQDYILRPCESIC